MPNAMQAYAEWQSASFEARHSPAMAVQLPNSLQAIVEFRQSALSMARQYPVL